MMDIDKAFESINLHIKNNEFDLVRPEIDSIVSACSNDTITMIKCASLLRVIDDNEGCNDILDKVLTVLPEDVNKKFSVAVAMKGLGRYEDAFDILSDLDEIVPILREKARISLLIGEPKEALSFVEQMNSSEKRDVILLTDALCASGDLQKAYDVAVRLAEDENNSYDSLVNLCSTMIRMGKNKEAIKLARGHLKEDKKNADALALGAYVMRINGKTSAAANFAQHALKVDYTHIGALETLALCLVEKGKIVQAKVLAGAINDKDPGNPAVIRILDACRLS